MRRWRGVQAHPHQITMQWHGFQDHVLGRPCGMDGGHTGQEKEVSVLVGRWVRTWGGLVYMMGGQKGTGMEEGTRRPGPALDTKRKGKRALSTASTRPPRFCAVSPLRASAPLHAVAFLLAWPPCLALVPPARPLHSPPVTITPIFITTHTQEANAHVLLYLVVLGPPAPPRGAANTGFSSGVRVENAPGAVVVRAR